MDHKSKRKFGFILTMLLALSLFITGCWDKVEINDQGFVLCLGIDKFDYDTYIKEHPKEEKPIKESPNNRYLISYSFPNLQVVTGQGGEGDPKFIKASVDTTIFSSTRILATRLNKRISFDHTKAVIFGKAVIEDRVLFKEALDALDRNPNFTRRIPILIAEDTAQDVLRTEPEGQAGIGQYVTELYSVNESESTRLSTADLGEVLRQLSESKGNGIIPRIVPGEKDIKIAGAGIIKDYKFQGWLGEKEIRAILWTKGQVKGSEISIFHDKLAIPYRVTNASTDIEFKMVNDQLVGNIKVRTEGDVAEYTVAPPKALYSQGVITELEQELAKHMKKEIEDTITKLQEEFEVDVTDMSKELKWDNRKIWNQVGGQWEEVFKKGKFTADVEVKIRRIGLTK